MSDTAYTTFQHYGTNAQRIAFTPVPGGGQPIYIWYETDTGNTYVYTTGWHQITGAAAGGGLVLLESHAASSSTTLDFTTFITSTYDEYVIEGVDIIAGTTASSILMRIGTGGGPTYDSGSNYAWTRSYQSIGTAYAWTGSPG